MQMNIWYKQKLFLKNINYLHIHIPLDFRHIFTVILPLVTWTLDNSNLPLTQTNFHSPSGHFLIYNFTLDNSNYVCQYVTSQNKQCTVVQNIKLKHEAAMWTFSFLLD